MIQVNDDTRIRLIENGYVFERLKWEQVCRVNNENEVVSTIKDMGLEDDFNKAVDELKERLRLMFRGNY